MRPEVTLGDYKNFNFKPDIENIDDARVDQVVEELRDQNATLAAVEDRGAKDGDYAVISFVGTRDGQPFEGGTSERMPPILGQERLIPGFEKNLVGLKVGDTTEFDVTFPEDYPEDRSQARRPTSASSSRSSARRSCRTSTTTSSPASAISPRWTRYGPTSASVSRPTPSIGLATGSPTGSSNTPSRTRRWSCPKCSSTRKSK